MNLAEINWTKQNYHAFISSLKKLGNTKYLNFEAKLLNDDSKLIGIYIPNLKQIAKSIAKGNYEFFIKQNSHYYYEEKLLHGLVIGYLKLDFKEILMLLDAFLPYNTNWAINDIVCANLKIFKKNLQDGYNYILKLLKSKRPFDKRFGFVLLLSYYINEKYLDDIFKLTSRVKDDNYYVKMAVSWLLSLCYINFPKQTISFLREKKLDKWTYNKTLQKIIESKRISKEDKEKLKKLKIKDD